MDAKHPLTYALRAALFVSTLAILAVFQARTLVAKLARSFEMAVSVPLSVLLLLLFAIHEALLRLKLKIVGPTERAELLYHDIDALFWSGTAAASILVADDLQSVTLRVPKGASEDNSKSDHQDQPSQDTAQGQHICKATVTPKFPQKHIVKAGWNMLMDHRDSKNYTHETIELVSAST